jgi:hypothetical protein
MHNVAVLAQTTNQAVYIRALRKARLARQRRHNNPPRPRLEDYSPSSTPWRRRTTGGQVAGIGGKWQGYDPGSADDRHVRLQSAPFDLCMRLQTW